MTNIFDQRSMLKTAVPFKDALKFKDNAVCERASCGIIGAHAGLHQVLAQAEVVAPTDSTVLIQGETGTGKEVIARFIHDCSLRGGSFVQLNCSAIPAGLMESELFGHERGAFTGAVASRIGHFEIANKGTIFLDEIGDLPLELQPKLLRVLQEREIQKLGGGRTTQVNVRVVAATNRDLAQMVEDKQFRADLFYRLSVFPIELPPLRQRRSDIPDLVHYFVQRSAERMCKEIRTINLEAIDAIVGYDWPGNVRQLQNFIERAVILSRGSVLFVRPEELTQIQRPSGTRSTLHEAERQIIVRTLGQSGGAVGGPFGAAAALGLPRTTLISKMKKLGISIARTQEGTRSIACAV
jgi:formate hydrogenlyase transcriptional activator